MKPKPDEPDAGDDLIAIVAPLLPRRDPAMVGHLIYAVNKHLGKSTLKDAVAEVIKRSQDQVALARYFGIADYYDG